MADVWESRGVLVLSPRSELAGLLNPRRIAFDCRIADELPAAG
jgi:hypothetical protein